MRTTSDVWECWGAFWDRFCFQNFGCANVHVEESEEKQSWTVSLTQLLNRLWQNTSHAVQTSKTDHFGCARQKWCNLKLLHAMVIKFSGNQQKLLFFLNTVKPVLSDHPTVQGKMVVIDRWSLKQGFPETDRFFEALLNSCERCGAHALDLRNDNSRQSGPSGGLMQWFSRKLALWWLFWQ